MIIFDEHFLTISHKKIIFTADNFDATCFLHFETKIQKKIHCAPYHVLSQLRCCKTMKYTQVLLSCAKNPFCTHIEVFNYKQIHIWIQEDVRRNWTLHGFRILQFPSLQSQIWQIGILLTADSYHILPTLTYVSW